MKGVIVIFVLCVSVYVLFGLTGAVDDVAVWPPKPRCKNGGPMMPLAFKSELSCLRKCCDWCCSRKECQFSFKGRCTGKCERQWPWVIQGGKPNAEIEKGRQVGPFKGWWACCCDKCGKKSTGCTPEDIANGIC